MSSPLLKISGDTSELYLQCMGASRWGLRDFPLREVNILVSKSIETTAVFPAVHLPEAYVTVQLRVIVFCVRIELAMKEHRVLLSSQSLRQKTKVGSANRLVSTGSNRRCIAVRP